MKYEYLFFNIIVISGPIFFGSLRKFYFLNYWKETFSSILFASFPFIIWDISVTNRHWFFADNFTIGYKILGLPIEEIMFFFTVPYACLFTWEMIKKYSKSSNSFDVKTLKTSIVALMIGLSVALSFVALLYKKEYTSIALLFFSGSILFDQTIGGKILTTKTFFIYLGFVSAFTLIFNGYLTWRPIVTYDEIYQLGFRIFTIPIEDFFFGYALMIIVTSIFEKMIKKIENYYA